MGKAHSNAYRQVGRFFDLGLLPRMHTICGRNESNVKAMAEKYGWGGCKTDWRDVVNDPEIDIVDVATPGSSHAEIACAAAEAGKIVFCEKPIGNTLTEAKAIAEAIEKSGKPSVVFHNYRKAPAVSLARQMIADGRIGTIYHFRAVYLQDWIADPSFPLVWRLQKETAGSGSHGDIGSHIIDMARALCGEFEEVCGHLHTFITERPIAAGVDDKMGAKASAETGAVTVDDVSMFLARFTNGALGTFEASRFAVGRKNHCRFEINGSKGSLVFNLERMNELEFYDNTNPTGEQGFRLIQATESGHPFAGHYWPVGHIIGYEHTFINLVADALQAIEHGRMPDPNINDGYRNQVVLDAIERSSAARTWVAIPG